MSIIRCPGCERNVDTDLEDTESGHIGENLVEMCWPCFEKHEAEMLAYGRELAGEHHRDLNAQGCTCRWVGEGSGDPHAHIKRDQQCPLHGKDPDEARDDLQECIRLGGLLHWGTYR